MNMHTISGVALGLLIMWCRPLPAQSSPPAPFQGLEFLIGKWTGIAREKDTPMGAGQGFFSFQRELESKIIVRRNASEYTSGSRHDDLMVIYLDAPKDTPRAIYFDSEGHVIRYNIAVPSPGRAVFESDGTQPGPRYRLTYWVESGSLNGRFEVAPPGGEFKAYMNWTSRKN